MTSVEIFNQPRKSTRTRWNDWAEKAAPYLFITPFLLSFIAFFLFPAFYAFVISFFRYKGYGEATWLGLDNYVAVLSSNFFWQELDNTIFYWFAHTIPMITVAFLLAIMVSSKLVGFKTFFKPVIYMPQVVAAVAASLVFRNLFGTEYGILNNVLGIKIPWLQDMELARWCVVMLLVWRGTGYWFVIFLAGLTSISEEIMDAATVDGVNPWQRMIYITIPLMRNTFLFALVVDAIVTLRLYTEPNVLGGSAGTLASEGMAPMLNTLMNNMRSARFGQASAAGWLIFILIAFVSFFQFKILGGKKQA